ncbi:hypothetical protein [Agrobacterium fabrum]|uniref:hypothetical protein n=1 Tax=Agrobacterium fabrum TaxID=1176649 RepID=UPI003BA122CB
MILDLRYARPMLGLVALFLTAGFGLASAEQPRPEVGKYVKAFETKDGVEVWTIRFGPISSGNALVQIRGLDHALDGKILLANTFLTDDAIRYQVELDGHPFILLTIRDGDGDLFVPGLPWSKPIAFSASLSSDRNSEHMLTDYLEQ